MNQPDDRVSETSTNDSEVEMLRRQLDQSERKLADLRNSATMKAGKLVAFPARKVRQAVRKFGDAPTQSGAQDTDNSALTRATHEQDDVIKTVSDVDQNALVEEVAPRQNEETKPEMSGNDVTPTYSSSDYELMEPIPDGATAITVVAMVKNGETPGKAPLRVSFLDSRNQLILPNADIPQNPDLGPFLNLEATSPDFVQQSWVLQVPAGANNIKISGVDWGKKTAVLQGDVVVEPLKNWSDSPEGFLENLPTETPLIIIDTTAPPLGHETLSLRPNNLSMAYSRLGVAVIFFPFGSLQEFPNRVDDSLIQFDRGEFDRTIRAALEIRDPHNSYFICSSFPSIQSVTASRRLKSAGWRVVYEARDDMEEFNRVGYSKWYHPQLERQILSISDVVVSVSSALDKKLDSMAQSMPDHYVLPNGVTQRTVENGKVLRSIALAEGRNRSMTVGYVGHLTDSWFDWPLLIDAATKTPEIRYEIVGHGFPKGITLPENVEYLGPKNHDELLSIVDKWKVGLIPFADLPLTRSVDPNKIYEYFAWGLRCVSAPMGMVSTYPYTWVYRGVDEFVAAVRDSISSPITQDELDELEDFLESVTWEQRAVQMLELIGFGTDKETAK